MAGGDGTGSVLLFRLLGPVGLEAGGERVTFSGKQGALVAALLLNADRVMSTQRLAEAVWDPPLPSGAAARIRMLVSEVRRACAAVGADVIATQRPGYVLRAAAARIDLACFQSRMASAREAASAGRYEEALGHYDDALGWWQGAPLSGITGSFAEAQAGWLDGLRLDALEERLAVLLALDRHTDVVTEARALAGEAPLRERLHGLLMESLHASGRRGEALEVYRRFRDRLVEELGLEPTDELQRLQDRILRADAVPRRRPGMPPASGPRRDEPPEPPMPEVSLPTPNQLPAPPAFFLNRGRELRELDRHLACGGNVCVAVISGPGGVGKTWLALHWAHGHRDRYPDGQLYANLRGFDNAERPMAPSTVLRQFLLALGVPPTVIPAEQEAQAALYRSVLADRRLLVVLDNARDAAQVTPLIPGTPGCTVLVTSRNRLVSLATTHGARLLEVGPFSDEEARRLLSHHLGRETMAAEPAAVGVLLEHSGGLPLALGVLAARAAAQPGFPLTVLAQELRDPATRLDALQTDDLGVGLRAVFASSYAALDERTARLLMLLGTAPGPDIGLPAAAALAGLPPAGTRALIATLETANLVRQPSPGRYRMHDLVRLYAAERARRDLPAPARKEALVRLVRAYTAMACAADRVLYPHRPAITAAPWRGDVPADATAALAWFEGELPCLLAAQALAAELGMDVEAWQLAWGMNTFLMRRCYTRERLDSWKIALAAADRLGDPHTTAVVHWHTGYAYATAARIDEATDHLDRALELFRTLQDRSRLAQVHHTIGWMWSVHGQPWRGLGHAQAALRLQREVGDPIWEANALSAVGWIRLQLGEHTEARAACEAALTLFRRHHDRGGEAATLDSLGALAYRQGDHERALEYYGQCLELRRGTGNTFQAADTLVGMGDAHHALGNPAAARAAWREALALYRAQHRRAEIRRMTEKLEAADAVPGAPASRGDGV